MLHDEKRSLDSLSILAKVAGGNTELKSKRNQIAYSQGDEADSVFYVRAGAFKVTVLSAGGKEAGIAILRPESFFGEECLAGHRLQLSTVTALGEGVLFRLVKVDVARAIYDDREFSQLFMLYLMERNIQMQGNVVDYQLNSIEKRLGRLLLTLAGYGTENRLDPIMPNVTQETLAEMIGSSRSNVNLFMNKVRDLGLIEYNGTITVKKSLMEMVLSETTARN